MKLKNMFLLFFVIVLISCSSPQEIFEKQLDEAISEGFEYSEFSHEGFSVDYPGWEKTENRGVELSVTKGYCSVIVNSEKMSAKQWYNMFIDSIEKQDSTNVKLNEEEFHIKYSLKYNNITMVSDNKIYDCNGNAIAVTITCIEQAKEKMKDMHKRVYDSAICEKEELIYKNYLDADFSIDYPPWDKIQEETEQRVLGVSRGVCSIIVDKHNALPKDIFDWIKKAIVDNDKNILSSSNEGEEYYVDYEVSYDDNDLTASTKIEYCNYQSYITQVLCVDDLITEDLEEVRDKVLENSKCLKKYEVPTAEKIQEERDENLEVVETIEDSVVKTNIGEEFGIDEEMVVYFINSNSFFKNIMKDFPKGNLVIKDDNRDLNLKVTINENGEVVLLEDGKHDNADVTLIIPLREALNIFNNAQNINPLSLISFALNVKTDPSEIKNEVIKKVLKGEYN